MNDDARVRRTRALSVALAAVAALIAVTCASQGTLEHGPIAPLLPSAAGGAAATAQGLAGSDAGARAGTGMLPEAVGQGATGQPVMGRICGTWPGWRRVRAPSR